MSNRIGILPSSDYGNFNLGSKYKSSGDFFRIQPSLIRDCVPGDVIHYSNHMQVLGAPNPSPVSGKIIAKQYAFFVPNRVVWKHWNEYISGLDNYSIPSITGAQMQGLANAANTSPSNPNDRDWKAVFTSMGLKSNVTYDLSDYSALPFRCLQRIYWDWFRDAVIIPDSQQASYINDGDTVTAAELSTYSQVRYKCFGRNYITNCLVQPVVNNNVTSYDNISGVGVNGQHVVGSDSLGEVAGSYQYPSSLVVASSGPIGSPVEGVSVRENVSNQAFSSDNTPHLLGSDIDNIRKANALYKYLQKCNVLGGRLIDRLAGMFGSNTTPVAIQMSEYLGQSSMDVSFQTENANVTTGESGGTYNVFGRTDVQNGSMAGQRIGRAEGSADQLSIDYHVKEHGFFIVLFTLEPDCTYSGGLDRMWKRGISTIDANRFDFLTPEMVQTGMQPITIDEVQMLPVGMSKGSYSGNTIFGYGAKYDDYTYSPDVYAGDFQLNSSFSHGFDTWTLARNLLYEQGLVDDNGEPKSNLSGTDLVSRITRSSVSLSSPASATVFDKKFTITSNLVDHFSVEVNHALNMTRPLPNLSFPTLEPQHHVAKANIGGTRF